jgi:hypothetical protein
MTAGVNQHEHGEPSIEELVALLRTTDPERLRWHANRNTKLAQAVLLAPTLEICEALLLGENVPKSKLDPLWAKRYGL